MIHLAGPVVLVALLAGIGAYGLVARRNAVLVLIGAEIMLAAAALLLVTIAALPPGGLATAGAPEAGPADPLLAGHVMAIFVITIAAAEVGIALGVVLLLFRARATSDLAAVRELGEASPTYAEVPDAGTPPVAPQPVQPDRPDPPDRPEPPPEAPKPDSIAAWLATGDDPEEAVR